MVNVHGGPTSYVAQSLDWRKQYFTSRGWAWYALPFSLFVTFIQDDTRVDVNYRGSSCYGRDYISRLDSNWGIVDIQDCIETVKHLSSSEFALVDPKVSQHPLYSGAMTQIARLAEMYNQRGICWWLYHSCCYQPAQGRG